MSGNKHIDLPRIDGCHKLWLQSCTHFGAGAFDAGLWHEHLRRAVAEGWRVVHLGDVCEMVTMDCRVAKDAMWEQAISPRGQVYQAIAEFRAIGIDAAVDGNHDDRFGKMSGMHLWADFILPHVRSYTYTPCISMGPGGILTYSIEGKDALSLALSHGYGPGANATTLLHRMMLKWPGCDVYAAAHIHRLLAEPLMQMTPKGQRKVWMLRTGTYLREPDYATRHIYGPSPECGSILLSFDEGGVRSVEVLT